MATVPRRYIPKHLSKKDKAIQKKQLRKSRSDYKKGKYHTRKKVKSFKSTGSSHVQNAKTMYQIDSIKPSQKLANKTGCKLKALRDIVSKGKGAYYSSGSRPNQTAHSWGIARLASSITGGPASAVDLHILEKGCTKNSKALKLARKTRKVKKVKNKVKIGGSANASNMKEKIVRFMKGVRKGKKYTAIVENRRTKKQRKISFGAIGYQQFKDRTPLKLYSSKNHGDKKRMQNYFNRHSGTKKKYAAIKKEIKKSKGYYTPKILSHQYLW